MRATPWRLSWFREWARWEGTTAENNPLATTYDMGSFQSQFNSAGVKNYTSFDVGVQATHNTLALSYYTSIIDSLANERIGDRSAVVSAIRTWGTTGFADTIANGWTPLSGDVSAPPSEPPPAGDPRTAYYDELGRMAERLGEIVASLRAIPYP